MQQLIPNSTTPLTHVDLTEPVVPLHTLDLGQHTLCIMSDGSISLFAHGQQASPLSADNLLSLDSDETYRLFISLHEQFQAQQHKEDEAGAARQVSLSSPEPTTDLLEALQARIAVETPWIVPLRRVHNPSQSLLAVKDTRLGNLCTAFGSEADYEMYCSLFHRQGEGGRHA